MSIPQPPAAEPAQKPVINCVFLTDQKYANLTAVAIRSLVAEFEQAPSSRDHRLAVYVVCVEVHKEGKDVLTFAAQSTNADVSVTLVDHVLEGNPQGKQRWVQLVSVKIHLPDILVGVDRVIFLDSDIVVVDDIARLWQCDLEGHWMGVVPCLNDHPRCLKNFSIFRVKFRSTGEPINAGVMVFDLALMRKLGIVQRLAEWQRDNRKKMILPEQEAISANYPLQWKVLPHAWNFRPFGEPYWTASSWEEFRQYVGIRPSIVHFQCNVRPFDMNINLPFYDIWERHHRHVNPQGDLKRKKLNYFQFIFFEYPDVLCRVSNLLPAGKIRVGLMGSLLGLVVLPQAIGSYLRYRRNPDAYELRIKRYTAQPASVGRD